MEWLALDIGGANLKAANGIEHAVIRPFPLWQRPRELAGALASLLAESPPASALAVTMTGELADCFPTKTAGVTAILQAVASVAERRTVYVYLTDGTWTDPAMAMRHPLRTAASNWHALSRFAGRYAGGESGLVVDIGSTTCDVIPLNRGVPTAVGHTDPERLLSGELVYTGVQRSPVCAVIDRVPWRGRLCPTAQEWFATTWDAYLTLEDLPEQPEAVHTADGRPATREAARDRLARCICADREMVDAAETLAIARAVAEAQEQRVAEALGRVIRRLPEPPETVVISGVGEFLARRALDRAGSMARIVSLGETLGVKLSTAATAHALAVLAQETFG